MVARCYCRSCHNTNDVHRERDKRAGFPALTRQMSRVLMTLWPVARRYPGGRCSGAPAGERMASLVRQSGKKRNDLSCKTFRFFPLVAGTLDGMEKQPRQPTPLKRVPEPPLEERPPLVEWVLMLAAWGREALAKDADAAGSEAGTIRKRGRPGAG